MAAIVGEVIKNNKSYVSTADQSANQFKFQKIDSNGQIVLAGTGDDAIGILQDKPKAGQPGSVCGVSDVSQIQCGGSFSAGASISSDSNGKAVAAVTGSAILGKAMTAGASGSNAYMLFQPVGRKA